MDYVSFVLGASITAILFTIISGFKKAYEHDKRLQQAKLQDSDKLRHLQRNQEIDSINFQSQLSNAFNRIEKLEKTRRIK